MFISSTEARSAESEARNQRLGFAHLLRADENKAPTSAGIMRIRRIMAAAQDRSVTYDQMLSEYGMQKLFECGALYFTRWGNT
jgi:hypothetical protein